MTQASSPSPSAYSVSPTGPRMLPADALSIAFLEPPKLKGYRRGASCHEQPAKTPKTFLDSLEVREKVFVQEQKVPAENELDADDSRAFHWVAYAHASVNTELAAQKTPVGTIRAVPFPHDPHPEAGGSYWNGMLESEMGATASAVVLNAVDRPTSFHDGKEPYVKIGRLAVLKRYRGNEIADLLVKTALSWLGANPSRFISPTSRSDTRTIKTHFSSRTKPSGGDLSSFMHRKRCKALGRNGAFVWMKPWAIGWKKEYRMWACSSGFPCNVKMSPRRLEVEPMASAPQSIPYLCALSEEILTFLSKLKQTRRHVGHDLRERSHERTKGVGTELAGLLDKSLRLQEKDRYK